MYAVQNCLTTIIVATIGIRTGCLMQYRFHFSCMLCKACAYQMSPDPKLTFRSECPRLKGVSTVDQRWQLIGVPLFVKALIDTVRNLQSYKHAMAIRENWTFTRYVNHQMHGSNMYRRELPITSYTRQLSILLTTHTRTSVTVRLGV